MNRFHGHFEPDAPTAQLSVSYWGLQNWPGAAADNHLVVQINGAKTAELKGDPGRKQGRIGLQLHGGRDMHVEFKRIEILKKAGKRSE